MAQREPLGRFEEAALTDREGELALDRVAGDRREVRLVVDRLDVDELGKLRPYR
jgi:hypothetical protein